MDFRKNCGFLFVIVLVTGALSAQSALGASPQPGLEITAANVDRYADFLAVGSVGRIKMGEVYRVFPTTPVEKLVYPKWLEMTRNPPQGKAVMLDEAGTWGLPDGSPWPGGFPFPDSQNAREIMANYQYHFTSDDFDSPIVGQPNGISILVNGKGEEYKRQIINITERRMTSRVWVEPIGSQPGYEDEFARTNTVFFSPYDVRGLVSMNILYRDQARLPDGYVYVPVLRRVRRQSATQRTDSIGGSDLTLGDVDSFSDPLGMWDFELLDTRSELHPINNNDVQYSGPVIKKEKQLLAGRYPNPYTGVELRRTHIIEAKPRYESIYSRKILHVDTETYRVANAEFYDLQGELLKSYELCWDVYDDFTPAVTWIVVQNMQTNNMTVFLTDEFQGNAGTPLTRVKVSSMKEFGR